VNTIQTAQELADAVQSLYQSGIKMGEEGLAYAFETEGYIQQAYEGRSLFELIQNARDASQQKGEAGSIWFELHDGVLTVANTGVPFTTGGVRAISRVGESTKHSADTIGFKGIGFKSVRQLTDKPRVVTEHGTFYFDVAETHRLHPDMVTKRCPLFLLPYFSPNNLTHPEIAKSIVTRVELPLRDATAVQWVHRNFRELKIEQLLLLGSLEEVSFTAGISHSRHYQIKPGDRVGELMTQVDSQAARRFQVYSPELPVSIPENIIRGLGEKEKDLVSAMEQVDIKIVLGMQEDGSFKQLPDAALYLFYPLDIKTGFSFLIHSYFLVNPERTALRKDTTLNSFLLKEIGKFIGTELLERLKELAWDASEVLCFNRADDTLIHLYNSVHTALYNKAFIFDDGDYLSPWEVTTLSPELAGRLQLKYLDGKRLVVASNRVRKWLTKEFKVEELKLENLPQVLESECVRRKYKQDWDFFEKLYNYLSAKDAPRMTDRAILLTQHDILVAGNKLDIFYISPDQQAELDLPPSLADEVQILNRRFSFKKDELILFQGRTELKDFKKASLAGALLSRMLIRNQHNWDLLGVLYNMRDEVSGIKFKTDGLVPTKDGQWIKPLNTPVYRATDELLALYPKGKFLDEDVFQRLHLSSEAEKESFMEWAGIWQQPGMFVSTASNYLSPTDWRHAQISSGNIYLQSERMLDTPTFINHYFTEQILQYWNEYKDFLQQDLDNNPTYTHNNSYAKLINSIRRAELSGAMQWLREKPWLASPSNEDIARVQDVIMTADNVIFSASDRLALSFLPVVKVPVSILSSITQDLKAINWAYSTSNNYARVIKLFYEHNKGDFSNLTTIESEKIRKAYNYILTRFYETSIGQGFEIPAGLSDLHFLSINTITNELGWRKANEIYYIDDSTKYESLPTTWQERLQPQFTKTDANQFGKIAQRIGIRFSNVIKSKAFHTGETHEVSFVSLLGPELVACLAILENKLGEQLTNGEVELVAGIPVVQTENLFQEVWLTDFETDKHSISLRYFVGWDAETPARLTITEDFSKDIEGLATAALLTEVLSKVLKSRETDWKDIKATFADYLESGQRDTLLKRRATRERQQELYQQLHEAAGSELVAFWQAVRRAKGLEAIDNVENEENLEELVDGLSLPISKLNRFERSVFRYEHLSYAGNRKALRWLLKNLNLPLEALQQQLPEPFNIEELWGEEWAKLRLKFKGAFRTWLYDTLAAGELDEKMLVRQQRYSKQREIYNLLPARPYPSDLSANLEQHFVTQLRQRFSEFENLEELKKVTVRPENWENDLYRQSQLALESLVMKEEVKWVREFLDESPTRDLLYFGQVAAVYKVYEEWAAPQRKSEDEPNTTQAEEEADLFDYYTNSEDIFAGEASTKPQASEPNQGRAGASGSSSYQRSSGAANSLMQDETGRIAEMRVYDWLATHYETVTWMSFNAKTIGPKHPGFNPNGTDSLGYDLTYWDANSEQEVRVEVKGTTGSGGAFFISRKEIMVAGEANYPYKLLYVTNARDNELARIHDLGNPFPNGETSLFINPRFTASWEKMMISFRLSESETGEQEADTEILKEDL
jgi:hypothetical protein